jgi:hypothetical protein
MRANARRCAVQGAGPDVALIMNHFSQVRWPVLGLVILTTQTYKAQREAAWGGDGEPKGGV